MEGYQNLLLLLYLPVALFVRRAVARGDLGPGRAASPLSCHVGVPREHGARDVPGDAHDHLVTAARLGELRYPRRGCYHAIANMMVAFGLDFLAFLSSVVAGACAWGPGYTAPARCWRHRSR